VLGESVQRVVERRSRLAPLDALTMMVHIGSALAEAHRLGMVHRDIKPANVLVTETGLAKLADFGLAKRLVHSRLASNEPLAGTPYFMAPELFDGQQANPTSDVYAMGVTLYYLLTGRYPFVDHSVMDVAKMHAESPVPDINRFNPEVSADVAAVIARCLAKSPGERYRDASELHADLKAAYGGLRSLESLVRDALDKSIIEWQGADNRFEATVQLPHGRHQSVVIEACCDAPLSDQIVRLYSPCAPASEGYFRQALELNANLTHASIGIEQFAGQSYFVMGNVYPRSTCDPEEIRRSVLEIARQADRVERLLTGRDQY
jgi:serine/threonine-protein kinase